MTGDGGGRAQRGSRRNTAVSPTLQSTGAFPRSARILKRWEFQRIQKEGIRVRSSAFTIVARAGLADRPRLGMAVSRKVGSAVIRNRIRRVVRELFRRTASSLPAVDLVMIAQPDAARLAREGLDSVARVVLPAWGHAAERALGRRQKRR